jgi:hypothetical protein
MSRLPLDTAVTNGRSSRQAKHLCCESGYDTCYGLWPQLTNMRQCNASVRRREVVIGGYVSVQAVQVLSSASDAVASGKSIPQVRLQ